MPVDSIIQRLSRYLRRHGWLILVSLLTAVASTVLSLYLPILVGRAIDLLAGAGQVVMAPVDALLTRIALFAAVSALAQWLMGIVNQRIVYRVSAEVRCDLFDHLQLLPLKYLDRHRYGELVNRVISDIEEMANGLLMGFANLFTGVMTIIGTLWFMFRIEPPVAWLVVVMSPLTLLAARFIANHTYRYFQDQAAQRAEQTAGVEEIVANEPVVQLFGQQEQAVRQFRAINDRLAETSLKASFYSSLTNPATRLINSTIYAVLGYFGAMSVVHGMMSVGSLSSFLSYAKEFTRPFNEIAGIVAELQNSLACAGRVFQLMDEPAETPDAPDAAVLSQPQGRVTVSGVSFSYDPQKPFIRGLDLDIAPGQRVALVGPTGCGKTTIINLLMRFYDVDSGSIAVDGQDIRALTRHSLRGAWGMVLQDTWLRSGTIRDNIAIGRPDATEEQIRQAAKMAHADSFIRRLPQGYDTVLTENGGGLSQGQKQLLCISRLMLALPPMLILDEATSSIDTRTELQIQDSFATLMKGRTSFIVAHRLSTIQNADLILVMKDGAIIERGTHESLLRQKGFYYTLYNSQFAAAKV
jgi:ATP-binding cassette subfamily B protein